jgi:DEAD/DEAH box helicase domain-containing protein
MGIDIGDLNTAYNNSTPPLPANFLQRVGRAGRKSGASVIINFAKNQNHDLYYFTDPNEMMEGEVNTPGCYLEAKDILRRHFMAYCFDSWASVNPATNAIS